MKTIHKYFFLITLFGSYSAIALELNSLKPQENTVYINGQKIEQTTLNQLAQLYQIKVQDGRYWYDHINGSWGLEGGPLLGFLLPNMNLGGRLQSNASNGNTNVFVNGRELHYYDVARLRKMMLVLPGRYWVDARGNGGYEGGPAIFNLMYLARSSGSSFYRNSYTGIGSGSSGGTSYVIGKDFSVITGN